MTQTTQPPLRDALTRVDRDRYTHHDDGTVVTQSSSTPIITTMLAALDVQPGHRVLEIGTGSGYTTALLAHMVGQHGHVATVDVDPALVERAGTLLHHDGLTNLTLHTGDAAAPLPVDGPIQDTAEGRFDRLVAWTTPAEIPQHWVEQLTPAAMLVVPVELADLATAQAVGRFHIDDSHTLIGDTLIPGSFIPTHGPTAHDYGLPSRHIDATVHDTDGELGWLSSPWLRTAPALAHRMLTQLLNHQTLDPLPSPGAADEPSSDIEIGTGDRDSVALYLYALNPPGLTTAQLPGHGRLLGHTSPTGAALLTTTTTGRLALLHTGHHDNTATLTDWLTRWHRHHRPDPTRFLPSVTRTATGWRTCPALIDEYPDDDASPQQA